eukprot:scaffold39439_cov47-Prasinocladus_malaysianus.AAC.1
MKALKRLCKVSLSLFPTGVGRIQIRGLTIEGFRGVVMVKSHEEPIKYEGPLQKNAMVSWVYTKHFNDLEEITPKNFNEFRRRQVDTFVAFLPLLVSTGSIELYLNRLGIADH